MAADPVLDGTAPANAPPPPATWLHTATFTVTPMEMGCPAYSSPDSTIGLHLCDVPGGEAVSCSHWVYGEARWDAVAAQWDERWYYSDFHGGFLESARVLGNPPDSSPLPSES